MKKLNKKGFTLIELLAVIIILGVLMIIAIPSVTEYIQNSRKSGLVDTASAYVKTVINKVNEADKLSFFDTETLYLVPVGHDATNSCVSTESGGASPFSDTWKYAYVGVTYDGTGYTYYFMSEDGSGQGIDFTESDTLVKEGADAVKTSAALKAVALETAYTGTSNVCYTNGYTATSDTDLCKDAATWSTIDTSSSVALVGGKTFNKVIVLAKPASGDCSYTG